MNDPLQILVKDLTKEPGYKKGYEHGQKEAFQKLIPRIEKIIQHRIDEVEGFKVNFSKNTPREAYILALKDTLLKMQIIVKQPRLVGESKEEEEK